MGGACARQFCATSAVARVDFDGEARVVWLDDIGGDKPAAACCLCRRHADTLTPPRHWELRDLRSHESSRAVHRSSFPAIVTVAGESRSLEPVAEPSVDAVAEVAPVWSPSLFASVDPGSVLDVTSPLLSRAFHGTR